MANTEPVRVTIFNQTYSVIASGDREAVEELAHRVDDLMRSIAGKAGNLDSSRIAVLACLHMADELRTLHRELEGLKSTVEHKAQAMALILDGAIGPE